MKNLITLRANNRLLINSSHNKLFSNKPYSLYFTYGGVVANNDLIYVNVVASRNLLNKEL